MRSPVVFTTLRIFLLITLLVAAECTNLQHAIEKLNASLQFTLQRAEKLLNPETSAEIEYYIQRRKLEEASENTDTSNEEEEFKLKKSALYEFNAYKTHEREIAQRLENLQNDLNSLVYIRKLPTEKKKLINKLNDNLNAANKHSLKGQEILYSKIIEQLIDEFFEMDTRPPGGKQKNDNHRNNDSNGHNCNDGNHGNHEKNCNHGNNENNLNTGNNGGNKDPLPENVHNGFLAEIVALLNELKNILKSSNGGGNHQINEIISSLPQPGNQFEYSDEYCNDCSSYENGNFFQYLVSLLNKLVV